MYQPTERLELDFLDASVSLESVCREFSFITDLEHFSISQEALEVSMEENVYGGRPNAAGLVVSGAVNYAKRMERKAFQKAGEVAGKTARGEYGLIAKAKAFASKLAKFINTVSMALNKVFATGLPLMGVIRKKANNLRDMARSDGFKTVEKPITVGKADKFFALGDHIAKPEELVDALRFVAKVEADILSKDKLNKFQQLSEAVLEPYRDSIKSSKVDTIVMVMAVLATITNPGTAVGVVLKRIFSAANPGLGGKVEKAATVAGGVYGGVGSLVLAMAGSGASTLKEMSNGRMNIDMIPKFSPIYPFCVKEVQDEADLTQTKQSATMLGNRYWTVTDFVDQLNPDMKGSMDTVGAEFKVTKDKVENHELQPLSKEQILEVCDIIDKLMEVAQAYCKQWPAQSKTYNAEYTRISDIVMTHSDDVGEGKKSATAHYVRYSYRNAMSVMLAGMWKNCFGADNQFVRYLVGLCRHLITYCNKSLEESNQS